MNMIDKLEAIRIIKLKKKSAHEAGTMECLDTFENGMECCLAVLEGRAPNYILTSTLERIKRLQNPLQTPNSSNMM